MVGTMAKIDDSVKKKVPELRFKGFTDDWEERKLGDLSQDTIGGGTPKTSVTEFWNGEIPWIQSSDLANDKLYGVLPKKFITEDAVKNSATKLIPANSIAIVTRVGVGKLAFMPYEFASSQDFLSLSNLQVDCNFGMYSIYKMLQRELNNIQGTSIKGITKADLLDKETFVPIKVEEQQKIGSFFKQLDDTIALHQRKLDLLKEQKKGYLQKMFPKNGAKVPELRFAGFADDWEERKLGEFGSVAMNRRIFKDQTSENEEVPFFKIGTFGSKPDAFISRELFEEYKLKYPYPEIGDILISASGSIGRTVVYQGEDEYFQDSNIVWLKHDNRLDNKFLKQFYSIVKWQGLEGSTIKRLYNKNILDTDISIPSTIEQNKIGMFFEQLDDTIALHQRKLDLLKEQKKGYLQKMFAK